MDQFLTRIANVSNYYRGAHYHLSFCSEEGGVWAYELVASNPPESDGETEGIPPVILAFLMQRTGGTPGPVIAMRCQYLEVICEALESWHAKTLVQGAER